MADARESKGITIKKSENFSEWYTQVVQKAELADIRYNVQGFIVHMPWTMRIARKIYEYFEDAVEADGHEPMLFPTVIAEEHLKKEEEHAGFVPEVFWVTEAGSEKIERKLALRPTGETQIYPMYSLWVRSISDLPLKRYQSRITVFRNEMQTRPFMRGREFMFFETHDVFVNKEDSLAQIRRDMQIMHDVAEKKLLIPFIFLKRPKWDRFLGAEDTYTSDTLHPDGRRTQISSTHYLGTNFAKAFNVTFMDTDGKQKHGHQTCFGPGIWRIIAALISIHGDDKGLVLPMNIAPLQVVIIPIVFSDKLKEMKETIAYGHNVKEMLSDMSAGYRVQFDAREHMSPGEKYNIWEMKGVPLRIEIGPKEVEAKKVTIVRRTDRKKITVALADLKKEIEAQSREIDTFIKNQAAAYFKDNTKNALTLVDVKKILKQHRGFVKAPWCSTDSGKSCADKLKEETTAHVCGTLLEEEKPAKGAKCVVCGKTAGHVVYIATSI
ncbi:MAG TPA: proline--tRNA ligase [Candidatus Nanoarchaeia archaeon]|nr:proline--tRNA ligase [Candidatus Nanoarchaeia archaeon]